MLAVAGVQKTLNAFVKQYIQAVCASEHSPMLLLQLSPMSDPAKEPHGLRKKVKGLLMLGKTTLYPATASADICLVSQSNSTSAPATFSGNQEVLT